jgi:hypothetical protein
MMVLASCSSQETAGTSSTTTVAASASAPQPIQKQVGQRAAAACAGESIDDTCALIFTVTAIDSVPSSDCSDYKPPTADERVIRVALDAQGLHPTPAPNSHIPPGYILSSDYWFALGADGYTTKVDVAIGCGEYTPGPFYTQTDVGQKLRGDILFKIPADSTTLELRPQPGLAWRWALPAQ